MRAKRLHLRLFLEGQEVPVISAVVTGGINTPCTAAIQVIPTDDIHTLLPRTLVHLFFYSLDPDDAAARALGQAQDSGYHTLNKEDQAAIGDNYHLLFAGEFVSYAFKKTPSQRAAILHCLDFSTYWDAAKQYFATGGTSPAAHAAAFVGSTAVQLGTEDQSTTPTQALINVLNGRSATLPQLDGLLGGVIRLLESIGGVYKGKGERFRGLNDFLSAAELRLRLSQMLGASPHDTSSKNLINHKSFAGWLRQTISRNRNLVSFRQILELLLGRIYHDYVSIPAPALRESYETTVEVAVAGKGPALSKEQAEDLRFMEQYVVDDKAQNQEQLKTARAATVTAGNHSGVQANYSSTKGSVAQAGGYVHAFYENFAGARVPENKVTGNLAGRVDDTGLNEAGLRLAQAAIKHLKGGGGGGVKITRSATVLPRLIAHVFRPNIYFCPPPRCNVLFPDLYTGFDYQRSYLAEVTRLQLVAQKEWKQDSEVIEGNTNKTYWAPNLPDVARNLSSKSAKDGARFIMPHEIFTGIVPKFDSMPDIVAFQQIEAQLGWREKIPYQQRIANYNFFAARFGPRVMSVALGFHPYVVPGVPALVIDKHRSDSVRQGLGLSPTQYLGLVHAVTHSVSQSGGTTEVQMTHCRTHNEALEYLGPFTDEITVPAGFANDIVAANTIIDTAEGLAAKMASNGIQIPYRISGKNADGGPNTDTASGSVESLKGRQIPGLGTVSGVSFSLNDASLIYGQRGPADGVPETSEASRAQPLQEATIWAHIRKQKFAKKTISAHPEQALFPAWMSPIYTNLNIGRDFYMEMFGIGSICDPVQVVQTKREIGQQGLISVPANLSAKQANSLDATQLADLAARARGSLAAGTVPNNVPGVTPSSGATAEELQAEIALGATIEQAVDQLVKTYAALKEGDYDLEAFLVGYCKRPIATLTQILGRRDLDFDQILDEKLKAVKTKADKVDVKAASAVKELQALAKESNQLVAGVRGRQDGEGFHSRAFGLYQGLAHLPHPPLPEVGFKGEIRQIDGGVDPRFERYLRVKAYREVLERDRGILG